MTQKSTEITKILHVFPPLNWITPIYFAQNNFINYCQCLIQNIMALYSPTCTRLDSHRSSEIQGLKLMSLKESPSLHTTFCQFPSHLCCKGLHTACAVRTLSVPHTAKESHISWLWSHPTKLIFCSGLLLKEWNMLQAPQSVPSTFQPLKHISLPWNT